MSKVHIQVEFEIIPGEIPPWDHKKTKEDYEEMVSVICRTTCLNKIRLVYGLDVKITEIKTWKYA